MKAVVLGWEPNFSSLLYTPKPKIKKRNFLGNEIQNYNTQNTTYNSQPF